MKSDNINNNKNMGEIWGNMKKRTKKIDVNSLSIGWIGIIIFVFISVLFCLYYINNLIPKKININEVLVKESNDIRITNIETEKYLSKIEIKVALNESQKKDYVNYTLGPGKDYYINYHIILKQNSTYYTIKTILEKKAKNEITLVGLVENSFLKENYEIGLLQKDYESNKKQLIDTYYANLEK